MKDYLELLELQQIIREGVEEAIPGVVRVKAEIASLQQRTNGHCYLELCQSEGSAPVAKLRAIVWRQQASTLFARFASATGAALAPGMSVIFEGRINYSELYGPSLVIEDIDVEHTLGEAELQRRKTIERLEKEGLMDLQKEFALPSLPCCLAVISAPDAAGYGDFRRHLLENEWGFKFNVTLFEATMQGDKAPASIIAALHRIYGAGRQSERSDRGSFEGVSPRPLGVQGDESQSNGDVSPAYDAVLILRGGGSSLDLACFDDYDLCAAIARCGLPVFTAIGHDRDTHVADMVACGSAKTPTALADMFIDAVASEDERIEDLGRRLRMSLASRVSSAEAALSVMEARIAAANPRKLLERGYTLVSAASGRLVKSAAGIAPGSTLDIHFPDGTINCTVNGTI